MSLPSTKQNDTIQPQNHQNNIYSQSGSSSSTIASGTSISGQQEGHYAPSYQQSSAPQSSNHPPHLQNYQHGRGPARQAEEDPNALAPSPELLRNRGRRARVGALLLRVFEHQQPKQFSVPKTTQQQQVSGGGVGGGAGSGFETTSSNTLISPQKVVTAWTKKLVREWCSAVPNFVNRQSPGKAPQRLTHSSSHSLGSILDSFYSASFTEDRSQRSKPIARRNSRRRKR